jgi:hypothetical protein
MILPRLLRRRLRRRLPKRRRRRLLQAKRKEGREANLLLWEIGLGWMSGVYVLNWWFVFLLF